MASDRIVYFFRLGGLYEKAVPFFRKRIANFAPTPQPLSHMYHATSLRYLLWIALLSSVLAGCRTRNATDEEATLPTDSAVLHDPASSAINSDQSELLNTMVGTSGEGVIRGIAFGDPVSKVKATETFEMFEDSLRHVGFTFETNQLETIDVLYYFTPTGRRVNKITVDVYLNSESATRQLWDSAKKRFTEKYGSPEEVNTRRASWRKDPVHATMEEVSVGKDYGMKLVFEPTDKAMLAVR